MSEKKPGFNPEQQSPEEKTPLEMAESKLDEEQKKEADNLLTRLQEAYFSSVNFEDRSARNKANIRDRYQAFSQMLDRGFHFLINAEKQYLREKMAVNIKLTEAQTVNEEDDTTLPQQPETIDQKQTEQPAEQKEEFYLDAENFFQNIKQKSGCTMENSKLLDKLIADLKLSRRMTIDRDIKFSDFYEEDIATTGGSQKKYTFYCSVKIGRGKLESIMKVELTFLPILKGLPGKQTKELAPKFFLMPVKK